MEIVQVVRDRLLTAQNRQKSYADHRRRPLEFAVDDLVYLRVSPMKGVVRFGRRGKLSPRYVGPFRILRRIGKVAYELALPPSMVGVHPVFHVSMLRGVIGDPSHVFPPTAPTMIQPSLQYEEQPVKILDRQVRKLRSKEIVSVKVQWSHHSEGEATWEMEDAMKEKYPYLFP
ncbi:uncharacterized protein LOC127804561 [Diospyros lotus]|uniref:uncharacterized protein LOC127804561 n=1 Tax=Diospyros lotus TaxID=55363 RepID=UPI002250F98E|nr:uncharacterized protein LOC127804561 [Diospyros lotus]